MALALQFPRGHFSGCSGLRTFKSPKWGRLAIRAGPKAPASKARSNESRKSNAPDKDKIQQNVQETLRALESKQRKAKRWMGQHYMVNDDITTRTVHAANIQPGDLVLEIGPGTGSLTQALVDAGAQVVAVEKDPDMAALIAERFSGCPHVELVHHDILKWPLRRKFASRFKDKNFQGRAKVVSNLPFNITTDVLRVFLPQGDTFSAVVLMLQEEAAKRIVSPDPTTSTEFRPISIFVQYFSRPKYHFFVPRQNFIPHPQVDAAVVSFQLKPSEEYSPIPSIDGFFAMVNCSFGEKRKMMRNSLQKLYTPDVISKALGVVGLRDDIRPHSLALEDFLHLFRVLEDEKLDQLNVGLVEEKMSSSGMASN